MNARFPDGVEQRAAVEFRASGRQLVGYAATFGTPAAIGGFQETIRAGAFRASLAAGKDQLALLDHDPTKLLARTSNGTLRLSEDARGLAFEIDVPNTTLGADVLAMAESRLLGGVSFGFRVPPGGDVWDDRDKRTLLAVDLVEVSICQAFPAYEQTTVSARAKALGQREAARRIRVMQLLGVP